GQRSNRRLRRLPRPRKYFAGRAARIPDSGRRARPPTRKPLAMQTAAQIMLLRRTQAHAPRLAQTDMATLSLPIIRSKVVLTTLTELPLRLPPPPRQQARTAMRALRWQVNASDRIRRSGTLRALSRVAKSGRASQAKLLPKAALRNARNRLRPAKG